MGTRADFYVGRGEQAEWLGSIAWDGYPDGIDSLVLNAKTEAEYRSAVSAFLAGRDDEEPGTDATLPEQGWPWPWETSSTTDYAYAFDGGRVHASNFGSQWYDPTQEQPEDLADKVAVFPDMRARQNVTMGQRSGLMVLGVTRDR